MPLPCSAGPRRRAHALRLAAISLLGLMAAAHPAAATSASTPVTPQATRPAEASTLSLQPGQTLSLRGHTLQWLRLEDSRCRPKERCGDAGRAALWLKVTPAGEPGRELMLVLNPDRPQERFARVGPLQLDWQSLSPAERPRPGPSPTPQQAELRISEGLRLTLSLGQSLRLPWGDAQLSWVGLQDQRCPRDLQCAVAGEASARFELKPASGPAQTLHLRTPTRDPIFAVAQGLELELCAISPTRAASEGPQAPEVKATVFVLPAGDASLRHPRQALCGP